MSCLIGHRRVVVSGSGKLAGLVVWSHPGVTSWYKNRRNRVTVTSPWRLLDYWKMTQHFVPEEFRAGRPGQAAVIPGQEAGAVSSWTP